MRLLPCVCNAAFSTASDAVSDAASPKVFHKITKNCVFFSKLALRSNFNKQRYAKDKILGVDYDDGRNDYDGECGRIKRRE